jgi:ABC-2 type transport system permease protein
MSRSTIVLVAQRELLARVRTRAYALSTAALVGGVALAVAAPHVLREGAAQAVRGDEHGARNVAFGAAILLYSALVLAGTWVASGVVEEKSSRVIEVMLAAIRPGELLAGKLIGIGLVALGQVAAAAAAAAATAVAVGSLDVPRSIPVTALIVVGWFVLGYALYACGFAAAASLVSRQEDVPTVTTPLNVVMIASFLTAMTVARRPDGLAAQALSLVPPFSPLLMPVRAAGGGVPAWQTATAVLLGLAVLAAVMRVAVAVYAGSTLRSGARLSLLGALGRKG